MATPIPANQCVFSAAEIRRATGATSGRAGADGSTSVSIDSRTIRPGGLFVALRGERDGHEFLEAARSGGAAAALVEPGRAIPGLPCFEVRDTLTALGELARFHLARIRRERPLRVLSIGGAAGKTTTKELTGAVARALFGSALVTPGNLNNLIGVPMTIFTLGGERAAVIECGTNQPGEIARLAQIVRPDAALVLNVDIEHTEGLGSLEGVAAEEAAIFTTARQAVVNADEPLLMSRVPASARPVTFGVAANADVRLLARRVTAAGQQTITLALGPGQAEGGAEIGATLGLPGAASAMNAAAALAAAATAYGRPLGRAQLQAAAAALATVAPVAGRLAIRTIGGVVVIDDSYNANPRSVRAAITAALEVAASLKAKLTVALGDMLELGTLGPALHEAVIREAMASGCANLVLVGAAMRAAAAAVDGRGGSPPIRVAANSLEATDLIRGVVRPGEVLLVKGSRGVAMEKIIEGLTGDG